MAPPFSPAATPAAITPAIAFEDDGTQGDGAGAAAGDLADDGDVLDGEGDEGEEEEGEDGGRGGRRVRPRVSRTAASSRAGGRGRRSGRRGGAQQQQEQDEGGEEDGSGEREAVDLSSAFVKYDRLLHGERRAGQPAREILTRNFLRKFIHYARLRTPVLSNQVRRKASNGAGHKAGAVMASVDAQVQDIRGSEGSAWCTRPFVPSRMLFLKRSELKPSSWMHCKWAHSNCPRLQRSSSLLACLHVLHRHALL